MPLSLRLALHTLAGWRARSLLLVAAVALASSLVMAVSCTMASIQGLIAERLHAAFGRVNARVIHQFEGRFDEAMIDRVRAWPEVERAAGRLFGSLALMRKVESEGSSAASGSETLRVTASARGIDPDVDEHFHQIEITEGRRPAAIDEVLLDPLARERLKASLGDEIQVQRFGAPIRLRVVGFYGRPLMNMLQQAGIQLDRRTLAEAINQRGRVSMVSMILKEGIDPEEFCARRLAEIEPPLTLEPTELVRSGFDRQILVSRLGFLLATMLGFLSCSFIVATGMTTAVVEQQRLIAIMRCLGGERRHLALAQVWTGVILSSSGAALGIPFGALLAWALLWLYRDIADIELVLSTLGIVAAGGGSLLAGTIGAIYPAWSAGRITPLAALAVRSRPPRRQGVWICAAAGLACALGTVALMQLPDEQLRFWLYNSIGLPLLHIGYFLLAVPLLVMVVKLGARAIAAILRVPVTLLREGMLATPYRHGFTAGAVMVGMAILVSTWSNGRSVIDDWLGRIRFADGFVYRGNPISAEEQQAVAALPIVTDVCPLGRLPLRVVGRQLLGVQGLAPENVICIGFDPDAFFRMNRIDWIAGDPATAIPRLKQGDAILVAEQFYTARAVAIGDTLTLGGTRTNQQFEVVGVVNAAGLEIATHVFGIRDQYMQHAMSCVFMDFAGVRRHFENEDALLLQVNLRKDVTDTEATKQLSDALPGARFVSGRGILSFVNEIGSAILGVSSVVAFAALVLACFGVGNVILAGIRARRYEYGVMLAIGSSRGVLARLILAEALLIGLAGAVVGAALGLQLAAHGVGLYRALGGLPLTLVVPLGPMAIGALVLLAMTALAALPAAISLSRQPARVLLAAGRAG